MQILNQQLGFLRVASLLRVFLLLAMPNAVNAQFTFTTNNDGSLNITGYTGVGGSVVIPNSLSISNVSFTNTILANIPVTSIGQYAFSNHTSLTNVTIGTNVASIGDYAFYKCTSLMAVYSQGNAATADSKVFDGDNVTNVTVYYLPGNVGWSSTFATASTAPEYSYTTNRGSITITGGYIGPIWPLIIPATLNGFPVTSIGANAFQNCATLNSIVIPNSVTNIGSYSFARSGLISVIIPQSVTSVGQYTFAQCTKLSSATINNSVIGDYEFYICNSLGNALIGTNVTSIGINAFNTCDNLTNVIIGSGVTTIGGGAFQSCSGLISCAISASVTNIGSIAFNNCKSLTTISVDVNNRCFSSVNGVLYNKNQTTLIQYPGGLGGSYVIPNSTSNIAAFAFANCNRLTNLIIPNSVTNIGNSAFYNNTGLTGIYFQGNTPNINPDSFASMADSAILYYLPGTMDWLNFAQLSGRSTVLWNPQAQTSDGGFGVQTNQFGFNITGTSNIVVVVQACTDLANPVWSPLQTVTLTNGLSHFKDSQWTNYLNHFYSFAFP